PPPISTTPPHSLYSLFPSYAHPTSSLYTLSLHDALPIYAISFIPHVGVPIRNIFLLSDTNLKNINSRELHVRLLNSTPTFFPLIDRKSTRLNSSHVSISYAVFCLKKKQNTHSKILLLT